MNLLVQFGIVKSILKFSNEKLQQFNFLNVPGKKFLDNKTITNVLAPVIIPGSRLVLKLFSKIPVNAQKNLDKLIYYKIQSELLPDLQKLNYFYIPLDKNIQSNEYNMVLFFYGQNMVDDYYQKLEKYHVFPEYFVFDICLFIEYLKGLQANGLFIRLYQNYSYIGIKNNNLLQYIRIINTSSSGLKSEIESTIQHYNKISQGEKVTDITLINSSIDLKIKGLKVNQIKIDENKIARLALKRNIPKAGISKTKKGLLNNIIERSYRFLFVVLLFFIIGLFLNSGIKNKALFYKSQINILDPSLKLIKPLQEKESKLNRVSLVTERISPNQSVLSSVLTEFSGCIPDEIRLKNLTYEYSAGKFKIEGYAANMDIINVFISKLNNKFSGIELISAQQEKFGDKNLVNFIMEILVK